ncbi:MAG: TIGR03013 family PEP-CTERM/XrtA system glycosyltransferase [Planctomycetes bacterium]|nr:TIGR03013 family PEP-CTERM/XrtA system glycosyltransferase [Planctomycetota bacterium]
MGYDLVGLVPEAGAERGTVGLTRAPRAEEAKPPLALRPRLVGTAALAGVGEPEEARAPGFRLERPESQAAAESGPTQPESSEPAPSLPALVERERVDIVVVALEDRRKALPVDDLLQCRLDGVAVIEQESLYERITGKIAVEALRPSYLIFNEGFSRHPWAELTKRAFDLSMGILIFALTWPLMLATAIAVRLDSPGPILFTQERVGRDGRTFVLLKFRSMRADAEKSTGPVWATQDDPRITRVGRIIRKTRLDELPQLVNVLAGHMSIVGPRPEREHFVAELAQRIPYFRQRHVVKPGLTGWAQINYRYGSSFEDALQKLQYDLYYIKNQSLIFDLSIVFNTVKIVLLRKGT